MPFSIEKRIWRRLTYRKTYLVQIVREKKFKLYWPTNSVEIDSMMFNAVLNITSFYRGG